MEEADIAAVLKVFRKDSHSLDLDLFSHALYTDGVITQIQYKCIQNEVEQYFGSDADKQYLWLRRIVRLVSLDQMIDVLRSIGMDDIASAIYEQQFPTSIKSGSVSEIPKSESLHQDYSALCKKRENKIFQITMEVDFENMTSNLIEKLKGQYNKQTRQLALDKLAVVVGVRHFILNTDTEIRGILCELKHCKDTNLDLDQRFSSAFYLIANIYLNRIIYDFDTAETSLVEVKQICFNNGPNWIKALVFIAEQALYRRKYALTYDQTFLDRSLVACDHANSLVSLEGGLQSSRMSNFLQICKVLTLLSFGEGFSVDYTKDVCIDNLVAAKAILTLIGRKLCELPNREKMIYRICMARLYENDNPRLALASAKMAIDMETCAHMTAIEKCNVRRFVHTLQSKVDSNPFQESQTF